MEEERHLHDAALSSQKDKLQGQLTDEHTKEKSALTSQISSLSAQLASLTTSFSEERQLYEAEKAELSEEVRSAEGGHKTSSGGGLGQKGLRLQLNSRQSSTVDT
eukprot:1588256-Pyramimonas_sp.AAC.1